MIYYPIIIAVDHGYGNIKTVNETFPSSIQACDHEPVYARDKMFWAGRWYAIGEGHKEFLDDKARDDDYYLLTMVAIAKELEHYGLTEAKVHLAVGLPLNWLGEQKDSFRDYLLRIHELGYTFNGTDYHVELVGAEVFPQGLAAVLPQLSRFTGSNVICDIGNGTMSIAFVVSGRLVTDKMFMEKYGTYQCTLAVREALMKKLHLSVTDREIEEVLCTGTGEVSASVLEVIRDTATEYVQGIMRSLREHGYNPETSKLYLMGGGACLVRNFGVYDEHRTTFNDDIRATAKGYLKLAEHRLRESGVLR